MSKQTVRNYLTDTREAIYRITTYITGASYETFVVDVKTQDAVIRNLKIISYSPNRTLI